MTVASDPLPVGSTAPGFALRDQHGATVSLEELRGTAVLLVFYPFAFSRVCGGELEALDGALAALGTADGPSGSGGPASTVLAISCDPMHALRAYADQAGLDVRLLSDFWPHGATAAAYGVLDPEIGAPHRSSFVIGPAGDVRWSLHVPRHESRPVADQLAALEQAGKAKTP
ncbi:redoxin domain-containing protein [Nocardioides sp. HDW12B]|uniref:redoxin domain-containing protein n=1 Tax=Nocardioides sp. HDW12B TaxID=2714939 RepID=UPI001409F9BE|nr:redoxin domain-containing protein [Nocardioides sp. HDW12B]QIK65926.1 redoxin domain-containing protein [Nocardioides sp. HDW12B]